MSAFLLNVLKFISQNLTPTAQTSKRQLRIYRDSLVSNLHTPNATVFTPAVKEALAQETAKCITHANIIHGGSNTVREGLPPDEENGINEKTSDTAPSATSTTANSTNEIYGDSYQ